MSKSEQYFVPDSPFNRENYPDLVGNIVFGPPSYVATIEAQLRNGAFVLKAASTPGGHGTAPGQVILAYSPENAYPFVTWWRNDENSGCSSEHYFGNLDDALEDYDDRCAKLCFQKVNHENDEQG